MKSDRWLRPAAGAAAAESPSLRRTAGAPGTAGIACPEGSPLSRLRRAAGKSNLYGNLRLLETAGLVVSEERLNRPAVRPKREKWAVLNEELPPGTAPHREAVGPGRASSGTGAKCRSRELRALFPNAAAFLRALEQKGFIHLAEQEVSRGPGPAPEIGKGGKGIVLNGAQDTGLDEIRGCLAAGTFLPLPPPRRDGKRQDGGLPPGHRRGPPERRRRDLPRPGDRPDGAASLPHRRAVPGAGDRRPPQRHLPERAVRPVEADPAGRGPPGRRRPVGPLRAGQGPPADHRGRGARPLLQAGRPSALQRPGPRPGEGPVRRGDGDPRFRHARHPDLLSRRRGALPLPDPPRPD